ncbi:hypothetical protein ACFLZX_02030 [Nanoarchaeota archaeon]
MKNVIVRSLLLIVAFFTLVAAEQCCPGGIPCPYQSSGCCVSGNCLPCGCCPDGWICDEAGGGCCAEVDCCDYVECGTCERECGLGIKDCLKTCEDPNDYCVDGRCTPGCDSGQTLCGDLCCDGGCHALAPNRCATIDPTCANPDEVMCLDGVCREQCEGPGQVCQNGNNFMCSGGSVSGITCKDSKDTRGDDCHIDHLGDCTCCRCQNRPSLQKCVNPDGECRICTPDQTNCW